MSQLNTEQKLCFDAAMSGKNLFISGPGGVGKSYVLRCITEEFKKRSVNHRVTASTGISAVNINGATIHSLLGTGIIDKSKAVRALLGTNAHHKAIERLQRVRTIIVDEVSMLSGDYVQMMDFWLKQVRSSPDSFGGCQIIFCGDFLQLPPVEKGAAKKYRFAFQCPAWQDANFKCVDLHFSFRQEDQVFVNALNRIRFGTFPVEVRKILRPCIGKVLNNPTHLVSTNKEANAINFQKLMTHPGTEYKHKPVFEFHNQKMKRNQEWSENAQNRLIRDSLTDNPLRLKIGVPVLLLKNNPIDGYVNGSRGIVVDVQLMKTGIIDCVNMKLDNGKTVTVERNEWSLVNSDNEVDLSMVQFPMRLGWALTIHKSQGLTLDNVEIDLSRSFACGQAYVALSRMKSLEGLALTDAIDPAIVKAEPELVAFYDQIIIDRGKNNDL